MDAIPNDTVDKIIAFLDLDNINSLCFTITQGEITLQNPTNLDNNLTCT